jgi:hypothetical protein
MTEYPLDRTRTIVGRDAPGLLLVESKPCIARPTGLARDAVIHALKDFAFEHADDRPQDLGPLIVHSPHSGQ